MTAQILPAGTTSLSGFADSNACLQVPGGLVGAGSDKTFLVVTGRAPENTSPTNPFYALMAQGSASKLLAQPVFQGFTIVVDDPTQPFGGIRVGYASHPLVRDVKILGVPGLSNTPPGETFGLNLWHCDNPVVVDTEVDGYGLGGSGLGFNENTGITLCDGVESHGSGHAHGFTAWDCAGQIYRGCRAYANGVGTGSSGGVGFNSETSLVNEFLDCASYRNSLGPARFLGPKGTAQSAQACLFLDGDPLFVGGQVAADLKFENGYRS